MHHHPDDPLLVANGSQQLRGRMGAIVQLGGILHRQDHFLVPPSLGRGRVMAHQHTGQIDSGMVEKSIHRFGFGSLPASLRNVHRRASKKIPSDHHQSPAQPFIAQVTPAKLFLGPILRGQRLLPGPGRRWSQPPHRRQGAQPLSKVLLQRIDQYDLFGQLSLPIPILAPAPLGHADELPVGRPVTASMKTAGLHERFHQHRPVAEAFQPILAHPLQGQSQHLRGQILYPHPGQDQKPAIVDDIGQVFSTGFRTPADPSISPLHPQRRRAEGQRAQPTLRTFDQIAQLMSGQRTGTQIVVLLQQLAPHSIVLGETTPHPDQFDGADLLQRLGRGLLRCGSSPPRLPLAPRPTGPRPLQRGLASPKNQLSHLAQPPKDPNGHADLKTASRAFPVQPLAHLRGQLAHGPIHRQRLDPLQDVGVEHPAADNHAPTLDQHPLVVQQKRCGTCSAGPGERVRARPHRPDAMRPLTRQTFD